jgi:hypothetical protein
MKYELKIMTRADVESVLAVADDRQIIRLKAFKFFEHRPDMSWAINSDNGYYLMEAPRQEDRTSTRYFFFYFGGKLRDLAVAGYTGKPVHFLKEPEAEEMKELQSELTAAFAVHRLSGLPDIEPPFVPTFEVKEI